ncbi:MAG: hypothetical protein WBB46_07530 [Candidatus Deferrimicrobiaceae bacterium]
MDYDHTHKLKFDRRLLRRRGWVDSEELEKELADLPDVSQKAQLPGGEEGSSQEPELPPPHEDNSPN